MTPRSTPRNASANRMARAHVGSTAPVRCLGGGGGGGAAANNGDCECDGSYAGGGGGSGRTAGGGGGAGGGVKAGGGVGSSGDCQSVSGPSRLPVAASGWGDRKSTRLNSSHLGISYA